MPEQAVREGMVMEAEVVEANAMVKQEYMCTCCTPPRPLDVMNANDRFAACKQSETIYEKRDGVYVQTNYAYMQRRIVDPTDGNRVIWPEEQQRTAPTADQLLQTARSKPATGRQEGAGGAQPQMGERVRLGDADYS